MFTLLAGGPFYADSRFWVLIPLVLFFILVLRKGALGAINSGLDQRSEDIANELDEARRLREEAQALLASYQRKQREAEEQAQEIIESARKDAETMASNARKALNERLERRAKMAEDKIANAEAKALAEVKSKAADMAISLSDAALRKQLTPADHTKLVADGIKQIGSNL